MIFPTKTQDRSRHVFNYFSIVVRGSFNPAILHPEWFRRYKILPEQEISYAESQQELATIGDIKFVGSPLYVTPQETVILFPSIGVMVTRDRYNVFTRKQENIESLKTVTSKIYRLLSHTPVTAIGNNFEAHWKLEKGAKDILEKLFIGSDYMIASAFGKEYSIGGQISAARNGCQISMRLEGSKQVEDGVYVNFNFHRDLPNKSTDELVMTIDEKFFDDLKEARKICRILLGISNAHTGEE
jgi:hypothetical protein